MIYVNASESLDDSGLPADFQLAWRAHIRAWREHSDLLNRLVWRSDNWDGADLDLYREQSETINETWSEVKSVAYSYGATFTED